MSNKEIKNAIFILCKVLNKTFDATIKPEHFRLAKFNKTDENVVPELWSIIKKILNETSLPGVHARLQLLNFERKKFYSITDEQAEESRELLIALSFILGNSLENHLLGLLKKSDSVSVFTPALPPQENVAWSKLKPHEQTYYMNWVSGKIISNNRAIVEFKQQIDMIQRKYNKSLNLKAHSQLSIFEILALKNEDIGERFLNNTAPFMDMMHLYQEWLKKERIFWKWMTSVLEESTKIP